MAYGSWPSSFTSSSYVAMGSRPLQIFSTMMVGAPIIWDTHTTASSGTCLLYTSKHDSDSSTTL